MRQLQTHARFGLLMSAFALTSAPSAVLAQDTCESNADCEHGYTCEEVGTCPSIGCPEGSDCEPIECDPATACVPVTDCEVNADCPASWLCTSIERSDCGDTAEPTCAPGDEECIKPEPADVPECNTITVHYCAPPWQLPCEEAADCGAGFECVERIAMACSGGGSSGAPTPSGDPKPDEGGAGFAPPADGDPLPPDGPGSCTSEPTGEYYCRLIETTCENDDDCAAGLTCQEAPSASTCTGGGSDPGDSDTPGSDSGGGSGGAAGAGGADFAPERPSCEMPEPTFACAPPSYFNGGGWGYDGRGEATNGGGGHDDSGGGDSNGLSTGGTPPPAAPTDDDKLASEEGAAGNGAMSGSSGGCSATGSSRASGGALVVALAMLGLALRRRSLRA